MCSGYFYTQMFRKPYVATYIRFRKSLKIEKSSPEKLEIVSTISIKQNTEKNVDVCVPI